MKLSEVKKVMDEQIPVQFKGIRYYVTACIMRRGSNKLVCFLELHDLNANSITQAPLNKIDILREEIRDKK